jgi:hypothetical protein
MNSSRLVSHTLSYQQVIFASILTNTNNFGFLGLGAISVGSQVATGQIIKLIVSLTFDISFFHNFLLISNL